MSGPRRPATLVKICGIRDREAAEAAVEAGADALGFVFAASPRRIAPAEAARVAEGLPGRLARVAVFRLAAEEEIARVLDVFPADLVQVEPTPDLLASSLASRLLPVLHDDEGRAESEALLADGRPVLFEAAGRGGRGRRPDWDVARALARRRATWLAGGLTPDNVGTAIRIVRPIGVDVSSGVERARGEKSVEAIRAFLAAVRGADVMAAHADEPDTTEDVA